MSLSSGRRAVVINTGPNSGRVVECVEAITIGNVPWWVVSWEEDGETMFNSYPHDALRPVWAD